MEAATCRAHVEKSEPRKRKASPSSVKPPHSKISKDMGLVKKYESMFELAMQNHRIDTFNLLKQSSERGESSVPTDTMTATRKKNMDTMRIAAQFAHTHGGKNMKESDLTRSLAKAEGDAVSTYVKEMTSQKNQAKQTSQTKTSPSNSTNKSSKGPKTPTKSSEKAFQSPSTQPNSSQVQSQMNSAQSYSQPQHMYQHQTIANNVSYQPTNMHRDVPQAAPQSFINGTGQGGFTYSEHNQL